MNALLKALSHPEARPIRRASARTITHKQREQQKREREATRALVARLRRNGWSI